jgi:hypothetical protein
MPLFAAVEGGDADLIMALVDRDYRGAVVQNKHEQSCLALAVTKGDVRLVERLLGNEHIRASLQAGEVRHECSDLRIKSDYQIWCNSLQPDMHHIVWTRSSLHTTIGPVRSLFPISTCHQDEA